MINKLVEYLKDKKILILGFGLEGKSTYKFIREYLKDKTIYIADKDEDFEKKFDFLSNDKNVIVISGEKYLEELDKYDLIIKTPGVSFVRNRYK